MKKIYIMILVFFVISLSACANLYSDQELKRLKAKNEKFNTELAKNENISEEPITVKALLDEFKNWDGNKTFGKNLYTLNLNRDSYILTIKPSNGDDNMIDWMDMVYIKPIKNNTVITSDEIIPMKNLASLISPYWIKNTQWIDNIIAKKIPYEEIYEGWKLNIDYYVYLNKKEGLVLTLSNLNKPQIDVSKESPTQSIIAQGDGLTSSYESKRKEFTNVVKQALNAPGLPEMCTDAYFNYKGELIIEVNGEWLILEEELRKDIVYALTELLRKSKKDLGVEGYGQFFSDSGRALESFYAK